MGRGRRRDRGRRTKEERKERGKEGREGRRKEIIKMVERASVGDIFQHIQLSQKTLGKLLTDKKERKNLYGTSEETILEMA